MKNLLYIISMAILLAACTNDIENDAIQTDILTLTVGDFPAFGEDAATRAIGTTDAGGKSAWEAGDQLLVSVTCQGGDPQYAVMSYNGSTWITTPTLKQTYASYTVTAWYAPAYQWSTTNDGTLALRDGEQAGLDECIMATSNSSPNITFTSREYSRLRIASTSSTQLSVSLTDFTPAGSTTSGSNNYTLTTDSKGNAYLYGTWTKNSNLQVTAQYSASATTPLYNKALSHASANGQSFAANAIPTSEQASNYNSLGDGSEEYPYVLLNATQLISLSTKSQDNQNINEHFKLGADITLTEPWTPITTVDEHGNGSQFLGTFDGDGHTISGLEFNLSDYYIAGLFGMIGTSGVVKNVKLKDCNMSVSSPGQICGGIAGVNSGTIENCHIISGKITSAFDAGGLAGICWYGDGAPRIVACSNSAAITGTYRVGGIVGWGREGSLIGCCNTGTVTGNSNMTVGGIVGTDYSHLTVCYFSAGNDNGYGTQITNNDWSSAITDMNNALQEAGYNYQYEMGANNLPVIKSTN